MFILDDNFKTHDDNLQPYSFSVERHTEIEDLHASVDERGFVLKSIGNRFILNSPRLNNFELNIKFGYTFLAEFNPVFNVLFSYDKKTRCAQGLKVTYDLGGRLIFTLINLDRMKITECESVCIDEFEISEGDITELRIKCKGNMLFVSLSDKLFKFDIKDNKGYIALERKNFIGELIIKEITLLSDDDLSETEIVPVQKVRIPLTDGGDIPYEFSYKISKIDDNCYLDVRLGGGTATRKLNREDRPGQYVAEKDTLVSPYTIIRNNKEKKFYLYNGRRTICDPNIFWECQKILFNHPDMPIERRFLLKNFEINENTSVSYGYESFSCSGYANQAGGPSEYIFDLDGNMLYSGNALTESICELYSPDDKYAVGLIPKNAYRYDDIITHLRGNHYFHIDEDISLTLSFKTRLYLEAVSIRAEIRDVYDSEVLECFEPKIKCGKWQFGYSELRVEVNSKPLKLGVYRIVFIISYGDSIYKEYNKVFEVFDKDSRVSPAVASGLPFVFSMPNEQKWLASNTFDLWNPKPSCDTGHFISCVTNTPIEATEYRIWEVIKLFGREWFAWLSDRTCLDPSIELYPEVVKNTDYLYVPAKTETFPLRNDLYLVGTYQNPKFRKYLHEFMELNPDIAEKLLYKIPEKEEFVYEKQKEIDESGEVKEYKAFTYEHLRNLMEVCHAEWMRFANGKILEAFKVQNGELKKLNPNFKRSSYGPFNTYVTAPLSYHTIKAFGNLPYNTLSDEVYTGFAVFEDYPASCAYQTCRGAFAAMTILLHCPNLRLYPEQYEGFPLGGCIDGAVKFSHSPMGKFDIPLYYSTTHALEYVYNTPRLTDEGFVYWNTYGFHRPDHSIDMWNEEVRGWKTVLDVKPKRPLKTMAMVTEYYEEEDSYSDEISTLHGHTNMVNTSEEIHGYIYETVRKNGFNTPFALKFDTLRKLTKDDCDVLVLPTLRYCSEEAKKEIRRLYDEGVSLVASSHVDGLEDIFGVKGKTISTESNTLILGNEEEDIYPFDVKFNYESDGAETLMTIQDGTAVIFKNDRAILFNASIGRLGYECFEGMEGKQRKNVSKLMEKAVCNAISDLSNPLVRGENVGVTLFESQKGTKHLLCIDYSKYLNAETDKNTAIVKFDMPIKDISVDRNITKVRDKDGYIREIRFDMRVHEAVMFTLYEEELT